MKKTALVFLLVVLSFALLPFSFAGADGQPDTRDAAVFVLPSSLEKIEDNAFERTAARAVVFQASLVSIGDFAFADSHYLSDVYIPSSTEYIGENAFSSNKKLTIHGVVGSYAAKWAKEHEIPFMPSNIWITPDDSENADGIGRIPIEKYRQTVKSEKISNLHGRTEDEGKSMRPQERPELNPIDYKFP